jgi:DNA primase catalytic subunit
MKHLVEEIKLQFCYPRLDINVTKGMNHLLKAPFSVHPKTEKICIVFPAEKVLTFELDLVPLINDLLDEQAPNHSRAVSSMQESIEVFQQHVFNLEKGTKRKRDNGLFIIFKNLYKIKGKLF